MTQDIRVLFIHHLLRGLCRYRVNTWSGRVTLRVSCKSLKTWIWSHLFHKVCWNHRCLKKKDKKSKKLSRPFHAVWWWYLNQAEPFSAHGVRLQYFIMRGKGHLGSISQVLAWPALHNHSPSGEKLVGGNSLNVGISNLKHFFRSILPVCLQSAIYFH